MDSTITSFNTPAIKDQDSLILGFFPKKMMNNAPTAETRTASKGFMDTIVSTSTLILHQIDFINIHCLAISIERDNDRQTHCHLSSSQCHY